MRTVAVIGSAEGLEKSEKLAEDLGRALAAKGFMILTGACGGLPLAAALGARKAGGRVLGISPAANSAEHKELYKGQPEVFDFIAYTGFGQKGRNVVLVRSADAVAMIGGRMGTLNEFTIAYDEGKIIGVLEGSGGTSEKVRELGGLGKETKAKIVYSKDPVELVERIGEQF
ncbi:MAG TPA: hypothetical protein VL945_01170 [Candidatus Saccharimonadales bacterium]|nr:hypothetical protein [Candidatus Saccharimonadales bacterium]